MIQIKSFSFNILGTNCYVVWDDSQEKCIISDPGMYRDFEENSLADFLATKGLVPEAILITHGHFDHIWGAEAAIRRYGCPAYMKAEDKELLGLVQDYFGRMGLKRRIEPFDFIDIQDGMDLHLGRLDWKVISTPGHSPGSVCYYCESGEVLLSGDTLMAGTIGRSDLPGGDYDILMKSLLEKLMTLPGDTDIFPGHGPESSIARESALNPFLLPFNEPYNEE